MTKLGYTANNLDLAKADLSHRFFSRIGGTSPDPFRGLNTSFDVNDAPARVEENRARVRFQIGLKPKSLFVAKQVHGHTVVEVTDKMMAENVSAIEADAMFTDVKEVGLGILTADCAPILLYASDVEMIAAIHGGWRSLTKGIIHHTTARLSEYGAKPENMIAAIGPCIGQTAFEVKSDMTDAVEKAIQGKDFSLSDLVAEGRFFNLQSYAEHLLKAEGIASIDKIDKCTLSDTDTFFSYRHEKRTGRQISVIAMTKPPVISEEMFG